MILSKWKLSGMGLAAALLCATAAARGDDAPAPKAPNIVLIFSDDVGWGDVGFNGRTDWKTPNLDRLAAQGVTLRRFYTGAVVCAPSRGVLLTGKYTIHAGVSRNYEDLPAEQTTIAEALKTRGYRTALFGKWHHGRPPAGQDTYTHPLDQGFDEFFGFTDAVDAWQKYPETLWEGREKVPVSGYADDLFTARGVEFIERHKGADEPFFLDLSLISAHFLIQAPEDEVAKHLGHFPERENRKPLYATYAAQITRLDRQVGQVMAALDAAGLADDTLIVFTSDHGATFEAGNQGTSAFHDSNAPFRGQKRTLWEGGIRVPTCARWPGRIPEGSESAVPMHMADLFPTFLDAAGSTDPETGVDGVSLLPLWTADPAAAPPDRTLFWEWRTEGFNQLAAMRGRFKLVVTEGGKPELFDVEADPAERRNVAASHPLMVQRLKKELKAWLATEPPADQPVAADPPAR